VEVIRTYQSSAVRALAIVAVAGMVFLGFGMTPASAAASHETNPNDWVILAPLAPDGAIWGPATMHYLYTGSQVRIGIPQKGTWSLDWAGGGGLAAGHYEGMVNCLATLVSIQEDPPLVTFVGHCMVVSPGVGLIIQNPLTVTSNQFCPTTTGTTPFRMEWSMHAIATGAYAELSGDGVAVMTGLC
jgi:hypothetical protein